MTDPETSPETPPAPAQEQDGGNPFDPSRLRLSQNFAESAGVKKALLTVPVRKPGRQDFVRVHPDAAYRLETALLEHRDTEIDSRPSVSRIEAHSRPVMLDGPIHVAFLRQQIGEIEVGVGGDPFESNGCHVC